MSKFNHYTKHKSTKIKDSTKNQIIKLSQNQSIIYPHILPISLSRPSPALSIHTKTQNNSAVNHIKRSFLRYNCLVSAFFCSEYLCIYRLYLQIVCTISADCIKLSIYHLYNACIVCAVMPALYHLQFVHCLPLSCRSPSVRQSIIFCTFLS